MINRFLSTRWAQKKPVGRSGFKKDFFIDLDVLIKLREFFFLFKNHVKNV